MYRRVGFKEFTKGDNMSDLSKYSDASENNVHPEIIKQLSFRCLFNLDQLLSVINLLFCILH